MDLVILDRDGVINEDRVDFVRSPEQWVPVPGSLEAIARLCAAGVRVAVATNQSGVGRGLYDEAMLAAIHRRALDEAQIGQNFDAGVGEKFFLLFDISEILYPSDATMAQSSYILFEVAQFDSYAYLFDKPHFVTLDGSTPTGIPLEGMRVAMNGVEAPVGQTYATMVQSLDGSQFQELGQPLSIRVARSASRLDDPALHGPAPDRAAQRPVPVDQHLGPGMARHRSLGGDHGGEHHGTSLPHGRRQLSEQPLILPGRHASLNSIAAPAKRARE